MKKILLIGLCVSLMLLIGCKSDEVTEEPLYFTTNDSLFSLYNNTSPSIIITNKQIIIDEMDCYPVTCSSNLCLECQIGDEPVNFTKWFG